MRRRVRPTTSFLPHYSHLRGMAVAPNLPCSSSTAESEQKTAGNVELPALTYMEVQQGILSRLTLQKLQIQELRPRQLDGCAPGMTVGEELQLRAPGSVPGCGRAGDWISVLHSLISSSRSLGYAV
jgi:hypothetical protein